MTSIPKEAIEAVLAELDERGLLSGVGEDLFDEIGRDLAVAIAPHLDGYAQGFAAGQQEMREAAVRELEGVRAFCTSADGLLDERYADEVAVVEAWSKIIRALPIAAAPSPWRPIETAPKDGTPVLAVIRPDLVKTHPNYGFGGPEHYAGKSVVVHHPGLAEDGFDIGWSLHGPFGHGLGTDDIFAGCMPLPAPPVEER